METSPAFLHRFAVKAVLWRNYLDWAVRNVPFYLQPSFLFVWTIFFFFFAAPERRSVIRNLRFVLPGSSLAMNYLRAFRTLLNFAWTITDAANYKVNKSELAYEIVGDKFLEQLGHGPGAIVLTAHMGNYDVGATLFAQKFNRAISMVRAPEPHKETEQHLVESVRQTGEGAVKIAYSSEGALLSFDLLNALRQGEIVSIQGDRVIEGVATAEGKMFSQTVRIPIGPFTLAQVAEVAVYPLFIVRTGYRRYKIIVRNPILVPRSSRSRDEDVGVALNKWCEVLQETIAQHWDQWSAFGDIFTAHEND
ncbi:MAG: LpxL/LpxP family acyltransferase [Chthoniobacterales bacterium]